MFGLTLTLGLLASIPALTSAAPVEARSVIEARDGSALPPDCVYPDYMDDTMWIGGSDDDANLICLSKWKDGLLVTGVATWTDGNNVRAIQVIYSDGTKSDVIGEMGQATQAGPSTWDITDPVEVAELWGNGKGENFGKLHIKTKSGVDIALGNDRDSGAYSQKTGNGFLMGMFVATNKDKADTILRAGFMFMKGQIESVTSQDFVFDDSLDNLNKEQKGIDSVSLDDRYFFNDRPNDNTTYTFTGSKDVTTSRKITQTNQHQIGVGYSFSFKADVLGLTQAESTFNLDYQYTHIDTTESTTETKDTRTWTITNNVRAGQKLHCQATAMTGKFDGDYTSTLVVALDTGKSLSFKSAGTLSDVAWSKSNSFCEEVKDIPSGIDPEKPDN